MTWLVILVILVSTVFGFIGGIVAIKISGDDVMEWIDDLQMQIDYQKDSLNRKHEVSMEYVKRIDQRETDHWNFINMNSKMW